MGRVCYERGALRASSRRLREGLCAFRESAAGAIEGIVGPRGAHWPRQPSVDRVHAKAEVARLASGVAHATGQALRLGNNYKP